jgi:hypothetical protein
MFPHLLATNSFTHPFLYIRKQEKSNPYYCKIKKNTNTDKTNKINLHNKKREQLISALAVLAHFMAGARSTV